MRKIADHCLWAKDLEIKQYPSLQQDIETDVLVIGGGVTGALCAYIYAQNDVKTVLIEKGQIANESTKASTSILHYEIDTDLKILSSLIGEEQAVEAFQLTLECVNKLEEIIKTLDDPCEFVRRPSFYYTFRKDEYEYMLSEYKMRKQHHFDVQFLDGIEDKDKFSFPFVAGIVSHNSGAEVNPVKLTQAILRYCEKKNMSIYENTEAFEYDLENDYPVIITKDKRKIRCKKVVMACGYDSLFFFDDPFYTMTRTFTIATKPVEDFKGWFARSLIKDSSDMYNYLRTTIDNRIIIGGEDIEVTTNDEEKLNMTDDYQLAAYKYQLLEKKLNEMFPLIENKEIEFKYNGIFVDSNDGLPYIDEHPDYPNIYFNIGIGSNGLLYGLLGAMMLYKKYDGIKDERIKMFRFNR